jgi:hypothetical protein
MRVRVLLAAGRSRPLRQKQSHRLVLSLLVLLVREVPGEHLKPIVLRLREVD